jgi:hypothetical protein
MINLHYWPTKRSQSRDPFGKRVEFPIASSGSTSVMVASESTMHAKREICLSADDLAVG